MSRWTIRPLLHERNTFGVYEKQPFMIIVLNDLPKISLNQWYSGSHWSKRKKIKDNYSLLIKSQCKKTFKKDKRYEVEYNFYFKTKPLDASNCVAMVKLIEDVLFKDDKYDIVKSIKITSNKSDKNYVGIKVITV